MLEEIFHEYHLKNPNGQISSAMYCEKVIRTKLKAKKNCRQQTKANRETISERVERLIQEGNIVLKEGQE